MKKAIQLAKELEVVSWSEAQDEAAAMIRKQSAVIEKLREGLHRVSLASQNSMSSKHECGSIACKLLAETEEFK